MTTTGDLTPDLLLKQRLSNWSAKLRARGLGDLAILLLDIAEPFGPLGAQALLIAQPALSLFVSHREIADFADLLDDPGAMEWWRDELVGGENRESTGDDQ